MVQYTCEQCKKDFFNKAKYTRHQNRKKPCNSNSNSNSLISNIKITSEINENENDNDNDNKNENENDNKNDNENDNKNENENEKITELTTNLSNIKLENNNLHVIYNEDCIKGMKKLEDETADIIICDPPYNIGKNFGNNTSKKEMETYLIWCDEWIKECIRILKPTGTLYIYGFSEILAFIRVRIEINVRWIVWHYTNKVTPSLNFWQRTHESILCCYKKKPTFNRDDVREPYTGAFLKNAAGKVRKSTKGRFSDGSKETVYTAHENGALPRDVIKIPALAGGAGKKERVNHPTQKPLELCKKLIKSSLNKEGETLLVVPFAGSGSECVAAAHEKIRCIGYEINEEYVNLCYKRLSNIE
uniref:C2H2-type domain-containing protein n=1 Tax=viral metagenome TaxID=1070528 RepID=A0A6C0KFN5_9ZZZZ